MAVDIEQLVVNFLRGQSAITDLVGDNVFTDLPHDRTGKFPAILVNRTGGGYRYKQWLESAEVSVSCYGGTHKLAQQIASTALSMMDVGMVGRMPEGVVTKVSATSTVYDPEPESVDQQGHARPRFTVALTVITHPNRPV